MPRAHLVLKKLESLLPVFGPGAAKEKKRCLEALRAAELRTADQVSRLHEALCFMQAWPDDAGVAARVERMLAAFDRRRDLKRFAEELDSTGIAGTAMHYSFYAATARWLSERWPERLRVDWEAFENAGVLASFLGLFGTFAELSGLENTELELPDCIDRLKGPRETDAVFLLRRLAARVPDELVFEQLYEELDVPLILAPGRSVTSRTRARYDKSRVTFQTGSLDRRRRPIDEEARELSGEPRPVSRAEGVRLVDLAHSAMVTRERDLDAFAYADPNDVSLLGDGGLQVVIYGVLPQRRFLLETLYGFILLQNGVPVSYGAATCLCNSAEWAYSHFDSFRGGESARVLIRALAVVHRFFGCDTLMVDSYQLGVGNEDAIETGTWWFYQKLGFRPRSEKLLRVMNRELAAMKRKPKHRSSKTTLRQLAKENLYLELGPRRDDVMGELDLSNIGSKVTELLAKRFGSDRERGEEVLAEEAAEGLGVATFRGWSAGEKLAWRRWSPLVALLRAGRWPESDRESLVSLIRAKGGRRERDYLRQFDGLGRLRKAVLRLAGGGD